MNNVTDATTGAIAACGLRKPGFENRPEIGANSQPCAQAQGHDGRCRNALGLAFDGVPAGLNAAPRREERREASTARVTFSAYGQAIHVSDADPSERTLVRMAKDAHLYAGEMIAGALDPSELRFLVKTLRQSLGDVLALLDDMTGQGEAEDDIDPVAEVSATAARGTDA